MLPVAWARPFHSGTRLQWDTQAAAPEQLRVYFESKAATIRTVEGNLPASEITALLGRGTDFEGKLYFEGQVRIDGGFRGEIKSPGVLIVGEGAAIEGEIEAAVVIVKGGKVAANVRATRSIELYVPAQVTGNLHAPEIFVDKGVQFSGNLSMAELPPR